MSLTIKEECNRRAKLDRNLMIFMLSVGIVFTPICIHIGTGFYLLIIMIFTSLIALFLNCYYYYVASNRLHHFHNEMKIEDIYGLSQYEWFVINQLTKKEPYPSLYSVFSYPYFYLESLTEKEPTQEKYKSSK